MGKYYVFILALGVLVVGLVMVSFNITGNPFDQKLKAQDDAVLSDFRELNVLVQNAFRRNKALPVSLNEVTGAASDKYAQYEYNTLSATQYNFCAEFVTDTQNPPVAQTLDTADLRHPVGRHCIQYEIPAYMIEQVQPIFPQPTLFPLMPTSTPTTTVEPLNAGNFLTAACAGKIEGGRCVMPGCSYTYPHDLYTAGNAVESGVVFPDTCSGNQIYEHSCGSADNGATYGHRVENFDCPKGCQDGACVK